MRMLQHYSGTLIVVSHDTELLRKCIDILWHIDNSKVHVFSGNYDDYIREIQHKRAAIEHDLARLNHQKHEMHEKLMKEQQRAAKSKAIGEKKVANRKWLKMVGDLKGMKAEKTQGKKLKAIDDSSRELSNQLADLRLPEVIIPKFSITSQDVGDRTIVQVNEGWVGYELDNCILSDISLTVSSKDHVAIIGYNGSGKSTLVKAILGDNKVIRKGEWFAPKPTDIGYLDQHYSTLAPNQTVLETISSLTPQWSHAEVRRHLNDFLFRKNEEVNALVSTLSGGEKARLSLAQIAARTPKLLILDEITNNLDLETKTHVVQALKEYPGAMIIISHGCCSKIRCNGYKNIWFCCQR
jgi:ATPase subunit of ABC transporter with duplicated ATPase domains